MLVFMNSQVFVFMNSGMFDFMNIQVIALKKSQFLHS